MDAVPNKSSLGSVNGIGQSVGSSARMIASPFVSVLYALSVKGGLLPGYLIYVILVGITLMGVVMTSLLFIY